MNITVSDWRDAAIDTHGETLFVIGDVHGCAAEFEQLLATIAEQHAHHAPTRLIFLGDLISKGPDTPAVLDLWASPALDARYTRVHRLFGNHEQLLRIITDDLPHADTARTRLLSAGGDRIQQQLRARTADPAAPLGRALLTAATHPAVTAHLDTLENHLEIGNLVFVHAGINPALGIRASLAPPWSSITKNHWAWIKAPFLEHRGGFDGRLIVHGHTPPEQHRAITGELDPHTIQYGRLCLDGGSAVTGIVIAAEIEDRRYRLIAASV